MFARSLTIQKVVGTVILAVARKQLNRSLRCVIEEMRPDTVTERSFDVWFHEEINPYFRSRVDAAHHSRFYPVSQSGPSHAAMFAI